VNQDLPPTGRDQVIGPDHVPAPETVLRPEVPAGTVRSFVLRSTDSRIYPGIRRIDNAVTRRRDAFGNRIAAEAHEQSVAEPYLRTVWVYVPPGHAPGTLVSGQTMVVKTAATAGVLKPTAMVAVTLGDAGRAQGEKKAPGTRAKSVAMLRTELAKGVEYRRKQADP
jgi:hypothetical protein